jgi:uncharacterized membrane-anchored protein
MTRRITVMLLVLVCAVQLAVPVAMIARRELAFRKGEVFRFRCAPVDPADPFRGRYVDLGFEVEQYNDRLDWVPYRGQNVFARIETGDDGFARIVELTARKPEHGPFVKCRVRWSGAEQTVLDLPFGRYYMEESKAPEAEAVYRQAAQDPDHDTWAEVRILGGHAVLDELYVKRIPIGEHFGGAEDREP